MVRHFIADDTTHLNHKNQVCTDLEALTILAGFQGAKGTGGRRFISPQHEACELQHSPAW